MSSPQKEHTRREGTGASPHGELLRFARGLFEDQDVADLRGPHHVARDDAPLVAALEHADLHLDGLARHARAPDELHDFGGKSVVALGHGRYPRSAASATCPT